MKIENKNIKQLKTTLWKLMAKRKMHNDPYCQLCMKPANAPHHIILKSRGSQYYFSYENLLSVCNGCHLKIHQMKFDNDILLEQINNIKGEDFWDRMRELRPIKKLTRQWLLEMINLYKE